MSTPEQPASARPNGAGPTPTGSPQPVAPGQPQREPPAAAPQPPTAPKPAAPGPPVVPPIAHLPVGRAEPVDPRQGIGKLSDRSPLVLLPVRIETRFVNVGSTDAPRHQLWVRIYPDDCSIDTFESALSDTEVANAKLYWQGIWRAGGEEDDERAAWRALVAAHGSGRAGYIVDTYQPANMSEQPTKANASDEILVVPTQTALSATESSALAAYWRAIWLAGEDASAQQAAKTALEAALGATRAETLRDEYVPYNLADAPAPPATKATVACSTAFVSFPPDPPPKQWSWRRGGSLTD